VPQCDPCVAHRRAAAAAAAQTYLPREPGSTANTWDKPAADTPIPSYYRESYQAYMKMKATANGGTEYRRATYEKMPDWSGIWTRDPSEGLKFDPRQTSKGFTPGPTTADLTPRYKAALEEKLRQVAAGNEWDQLSDCLPAGYPRWLTEPFLREFILTPSETWWVNEQQSEARRIYTDGRGHIPDAEAQPLWDGDSIGFWDGQTLRRTGDYLLSSDDGRTPISGISKFYRTRLKNAIIASTGGNLAKEFTSHDLRRTVATRLAEVLGENGDKLVKRVLGHSDGSVTAIYNRYAYVREKRDALDRWANELTTSPPASKNQPSAISSAGPPSNFATVAG
jgi:hypothetical protein